MKHDKQYHVTSAIYRMLRQRRIGQTQAAELLSCRAKLSAKLAKATAEVWMPSLRHLWRMEDQGLDQWGHPL